LAIYGVVKLLELSTNWRSMSLAFEDFYDWTSFVIM